MALAQSKQIVAKFQFPTPDDARDTIAVSAEYVVPTGGRAVNDVIEMAVIPPKCVVADGTIHFTAGGGTAALDWGVLSGTFGDASAATGQARTCGNEYAASASVVAAGVSRLAKNQTVADQPDDTVAWGFKVLGSALPAGMIIRAHLFVRPEIVGMV